jgi:hypothetical protein
MVAVTVMSVSLVLWLWPAPRIWRASSLRV